MVLVNVLYRSASNGRVLDLRLRGHGFKFQSGNNNLELVVYTFVHLSPSCIILYLCGNGSSAHGIVVVYHP